ncbi:MAG TPA: hypothetical protein VMJ52_15090 [Xanthobacteraceae bacterium]|nr:hypothetical protein [Xanthobacteraceae bacterium]
MSLITTIAEAEKAIADVTALLEKLSGLLEEETALVRTGKVKHISEIGSTKTTLANELFAAGERLKANAKFLLQTVPARCTALQRLQERFRAILQKNMMVLATTHAVSEGIVRRLSGDLARKHSPQIYGASGRATTPNPKQSRPLAVSRTL